MAQAVRIDLSPEYRHALKWHQDHFDFSSMKNSAISLNINYKDSYTVWSPFTKANKSIGTMEVLVGSHKYGRHDHDFEKPLNKNRSTYSVADTVELKVSKNILNFLPLLVNTNEKKIHINWDDEIIKAVVLTHNGKLILEQFK